MTSYLTVVQAGSTQYVCSVSYMTATVERRSGLILQRMCNGASGARILSFVVDTCVAFSLSCSAVRVAFSSAVCFVHVAQYVLPSQALSALCM